MTAWIVGRMREPAMRLLFGPDVCAYQLASNASQSRQLRVLAVR